MQHTLRVAGIQTQLTWEQPQANRDRFDKLIGNVEADLVVLPEMFSTGFTMNPQEVAETMDGPTITWMKSRAKIHDCAIVGSLVIKEESQYFNRLIFMHPEGTFETYDKKHLFTLAGEHKSYQAGTQRLIVDFKGWKICPLICYDLRFPVWARNVEKYDLLLYVANWPAPRIHAWNSLLQARAIENMSYCIGVNRVGVDVNDYVYSGHSAAYDFLGEILYKTQPSKEEVFLVSLEKQQQEETRKKLNFLNDQGAFQII